MGDSGDEEGESYAIVRGSDTLSEGETVRDQISIANSKKKQRILRW